VRLKKRGYRWSAGDEGRPKAWYVDIDEAKRDDEIAYLRQSIYLRDVDLFAQTLSVARQSGWKDSDNQDGHFGGRGERMIVAARR
jgi:hypothetical protein